MTPQITYANQKQSNSAYQMKVVLRRFSCENIKEEIFMGEVYVSADSVHGKITGVVKVRGGKEWIDFPQQLRWEGFKKQWS